MAASGGPDTAQGLAPSGLKIYISPFGTTMPVDESIALASTWYDLGYLAEDGQAFNEDRTVNQTFTYTGELFRETVTRRLYTLEGTLLQHNSQALQAVYGGGVTTVVGDLATFTPPSGRTNRPFAAILEMVDGTNAHRILVPKVTSAAGANRPIAAGVVSMPLRLSVTATIGVAPWTEITNDVTAFSALA